MMFNGSMDRFIVSFEAWFNQKLPYAKIIKDEYLRYDNWDGGTWYIDIDYVQLYKLHLGVDDFDYAEIFGNPMWDINDFKTFIEIIYEECIENRYQFTIEVNKRLKSFNAPYKLQNGKFIKEGYKTTERIDKIINHEMCERKIKFSEEMISSQELLDKKVALDYIVDSLQYLISIADGKGVNDKYRALGLTVANNDTNKIYPVVKDELDEIMKISNEFFDIRHNEYLNKAKERREPLNDKIFIEYLYNRIYALTYLLRLKLSIKSKEENQDG